MSRTYGVEIEFVPSQVPGDWGASQPLFNEMISRVSAVSTTVLGHAVAAVIRLTGVDCQFLGYTKAVQYNRWKIVTDASVRGLGLELVSPPLTEDQFGQIETVCNALKSIRARTDFSCGLHVHVGLEPSTAQGDAVHETLRRIVGLYSEHEATIDSFMPPSRRASANSYCRSLRGNVDYEKLRTARNADDLCRAVAGGNRNVKLNLNSYRRQQTVEFRQHSGTIDPVKIIRWMQFCGKLVDVAQAGVEPVIPVDVAVQQLAQRKLLNKSRTIVRLIARPEGVTSDEVMTALGRRSPPSSLAADLRRLGIPFVEAGRRNKRTVYKLPPDDATAGTFEKLMTQLAFAPDERYFWTTRRLLLANAAATNPTADAPLEVTGVAAQRVTRSA